MKRVDPGYNSILSSLQRFLKLYFPEKSPSNDQTRTIFSFSRP